MIRVTSAAYQLRPKPEPKLVLKKFLKIIRRSTIDEKMMKIPPRFVRLVPKLSDKVTIETPVGVKHSIRIKRSGHEVWFEKGWTEFAEAHSISEGHLLIFHYKGNSSFLVVICDKSASEIDYPLNNVCVIESDDDNKMMEVVDDVIDLDELLKENVTTITPSLEALSLSKTKPNKSETVSTTIVDVEEIDSMDEAEDLRLSRRIKRKLKTLALAI